jgi:hypothetical protein
MTLHGIVNRCSPWLEKQRVQGMGHGESKKRRAIFLEPQSGDISVDVRLIINLAPEYNLLKIESKYPAP